MPHKCARCQKIYDDNAIELMNGCSCGSRVFLYLRKRKGEKGEEEAINELKGKEISKSDLDWIERRFGKELERGEKVISLDIENLLQLDEGKFRLDISSLMRGEPLVMKSKNGVYYIDIAYAMKKKKR